MTASTLSRDSASFTVLNDLDVATDHVKTAMDALDAAIKAYSRSLSATETRRTKELVTRLLIDAIDANSVAITASMAFAEKSPQRGVPLLNKLRSADSELRQVAQRWQTGCVK